MKIRKVLGLKIASLFMASQAAAQGLFDSESWSGLSAAGTYERIYLSIIGIYGVTLLFASAYFATQVGFGNPEERSQSINRLAWAWGGFIVLLILPTIANFITGGALPTIF